MRIIVLDTLKPGFHGGSFCKERANWLSKTLEEQPEKPTLIALHHPPIDTGIPWMTTSFDAPWVTRFRNVISSHNNIIQIISGHVHRRISKPFANSYVCVSGAIAPQVKLDLSPIVPTVPDGRILLIDGPAEYCLHQWDGKSLTTHSSITPAGKPIVHFDKEHAFIVPQTLDLNPKKTILD